MASKFFIKNAHYCSDKKRVVKFCTKCLTDKNLWQFRSCVDICKICERKDNKYIHDKLILILCHGCNKEKIY